MKILNEHNALMVIDQLSEGIDWFKLIVSNNTHAEIAKRIKATPTIILQSLAEGNLSESINNQHFQMDYAIKELVFRASCDIDTSDGDPRFVGKIIGYDRIDKSIHEELSSDDPVEKWIADFISSDNPKFEGKTKKERINMALGAFYAAQKKEETIQEKRDLRIVSLATKAIDESLIKFFISSTPDITSKPVLEIKDLFEEFIFDLVEATISIGSKSSVKCVKQWGACKVGEVFDGIWKPAARPSQLKLDLDNSLPRATAHPIIFFDKITKQLSIPKQFELL